MASQEDKPHLQNSWKVQGMWKAGHSGSGAVLCQLLSCGGRDGRPSCHMIWGAECYIPDKNSSFPIQTPINEEGHVLDLPSKKDRFKLGRLGVHLRTHFQCNLYHFRNIQEWDLDPNCMNNDTISFVGKYG